MRRIVLTGLLLLVIGFGFSFLSPKNSSVVTPVYAATMSPATQLFLRIDGISGDVIDDIHKGELGAESFALSITRLPGASRPALGDLKVTLPVSAASPKLLVYATSGGRVPKAVLTLRSGSQDIGRWILTDSSITSYQTVGNTKGDGFSEQITLSYAKIEFEYSSSLKKTHGGWDQRANKAVQ